MISRMHLKCNECQSVTTVTLDPPFVALTGVKYCPICASPNIKMVDMSKDYWALLATDLDINLTLLHELYALWNSEDYGKFTDFVAAFKTSSTPVSE